MQVLAPGPLLRAFAPDGPDSLCERNQFVLNQKRSERLVVWACSDPTVFSVTLRDPNRSVVARHVAEICSQVFRLAGIKHAEETGLKLSYCRPDICTDGRVFSLRLLASVVRRDQTSSNSFVDL